MEDKLAVSISPVERFFRVVLSIILLVISLFFLLFSLHYFLNTFKNIGSGVTMATPAEFGAAYGGFVFGPIIFCLSVLGIFKSWKVAFKKTQPQGE